MKTDSEEIYRLIFGGADARVKCGSPCVLQQLLEFIETRRQTEQLVLIKDGPAARFSLTPSPYGLPYHFLNPTNTEDYEHRRLSIYQISSRCDGLTATGKRLTSENLVAGRELNHLPLFVFCKLLKT